ncbi:hypothetical protein [Luteithermobacter gelatinilyticus]|uniref:hypothetical protein n=1 Tax=Luteithermobacter gelatinilyticus TaxID=2582913 RepID=UPI0011067415|nr:hypothetical protein [Luteithermobacter gelatinilyticus]
MQNFVKGTMIALGMVIAVAGVGAMQASAGSLGKNVHQADVEVSDGVSKSEAKKLVKEFLKDKGKRNLRPGDVNKARMLEGSEFRDKWKVDIQSLNRMIVGRLYVDTETGEITTKK